MSFESIKEIFHDVLEFEEQALSTYGRISLGTRNKKIKDTLREIMKDEAVHAQNAREILMILDE